MKTSFSYLKRFMVAKGQTLSDKKIISFSGAQSSYRFLVGIHQKVGWENGPNKPKKN